MTPIHTITNYLSKRNLTQKSLAKKWKIAAATLGRYIKGAPIHPKVAEKIEKLSGMEIKYEELTSKPRKKRRKKIGNKWVKADEVY